MLDLAASRVDARFPTEPLIAADIHLTLARAYRSTGSYKIATDQLRSAIKRMRSAADADTEQRILAQYELVDMLGHLSQFDEASALLAVADKDAASRSGASEELRLRAHLAHGGLAYQRMQFADARQHIGAAIDGLSKLGNPNSPAINAGRVSLADLLSDMGRHTDALAMIRSIDPAAYQAASTAPGKIATLQAVEARIMLRMDQRAEALTMLHTAIAKMEAASVPEEQIKPFRELLVMPADAADGDAADDMQQP